MPMHALGRRVRRLLPPIPSEYRSWVRAFPGGAANPTFLLIGTPQAGTTWLHRNLVLHPDVDIPWKEMTFWSRHPHAPTWLYRRAFDPRKPVRGDMSPHYGALRRDLIERVRRELGDVRLLLIVRDPVERAWSAVRRKLPPGDWDVDHVRSLLDDSATFYPGLDAGVDFGRYSVVAENWLRVFSRDALEVVPFGDIATDPAGVIRSVLQHLGADLEAFPWKAVVQARVNSNPTGEMPSELRGYLTERYAGECARLQSLLGVEASW